MTMTGLETESYQAVKAQTVPRGIWIHAAAMMTVADRFKEENGRLLEKIIGFINENNQLKKELEMAKKK